MMKKYFNFLMVFASFVALTLFVSCSEDEPGIDDGDDDDGQVVTVDNGMYLVGSATSTTAVSDFRMGGGVVGNQDGVESRSGMFSAFVYLGSGTFQFIEYSDGDSTIWGGDITVAPMSEGSDYNMGTGTASVDGAAIAPLEENILHHVVIDKISGTIYMSAVKQWEIIGSATEGDWSSGTQLSLVSSTVESTVFEVNDVELGTFRSGQEYKFRYNSSWDIAFDDVEGFNVFTNFGITDDELLVGGANIQLEEPGVYAINATFDSEGPAFTVTRTGDADPIDNTFDPENYKWGVLGTATAGGFDNDRDLLYKGVDETKGHWWAGLVYLIADDGEDGEDGSLVERFKFRANDAWDVNLGGSIGEEAGTLDLSGGDIPAPAESGAYYIEIYTTDEGASWNGSMVASAGWGVIGDGSPIAGWQDGDVDMTANGFADGVTTYSFTGDFTTDGWKFRANDDWVLDLGGDLAALSFGGDNISLSEGGSKTVTLSVSTAEDGTTMYAATIE